MFYLLFTIHRLRKSFVLSIFPSLLMENWRSFLQLKSIFQSKSKIVQKNWNPPTINPNTSQLPSLTEYYQVSFVFLINVFGYYHSWPFLIPSLNLSPEKYQNSHPKYQTFVSCTTVKKKSWIQCNGVVQNEILLLDYGHSQSRIN